MATKQIAVLTSVGDAPGMNAREQWWLKLRNIANLMAKLAPNHRLEIQ